MRFVKNGKLFKSALAFLCVVASAYAAGCAAETDDGSGDESGSRLETGIAGDKQVAEVDDEEASSLCSEIQAAQTGDVLQGMCLMAVRDIVDDVAECDQALDECMMELDVFSDEDLAECSEDVQSWECDTKVGDFEACIGDFFDALATIGRGGCEDAMNISAEALDRFADPASCGRVQESCPEAFGESEGGGGEVVVTGELDGVDITLASNGYGSSGFEGGGQWGVDAYFADSQLRLWGDKEASHGLLLMPQSGPFPSEWMCLGDVEAEPPGEDAFESTWSSSDVSSLGACSGAEGLPLELDFSIAGELQGTFRGEPVSWNNTGYGCQLNRCELNFGNAEGSITLLVELNGTSFTEGGTHEVLSSAIVDAEGQGAVACGGAGTITQEENGAFSVRIENFSDFSSCPGESLEGSLSGRY